MEIKFKENEGIEEKNKQTNFSHNSLRLWFYKFIGEDGNGETFAFETITT